MTGINPVTLRGQDNNVSIGRLWIMRRSIVVPDTSLRHGRNVPTPEEILRRLTLIMWNSARDTNNFPLLLDCEDIFINAYNQLKMNNEVVLQGTGTPYIITRKSNKIVFTAGNRTATIDESTFHEGLAHLFPNGELTDNPPTIQQIIEECIKKDFVLNL